ncbi:MAG TPA: hypothetical protein VFL57_19940 [Bryobacteraceae bacterium]|nr:hypothetical protein [Bryobacteraceae bacterium]
MLQAVLPSAAQSPAPPAKAKAAKPVVSPRKQAPATAAPRIDPKLLNNDAIVSMVAAGIDEQTIIAKIRSSSSIEFQLDADNLIRLKEANVPQAVIRAMLNAKAPAPQPAAAVIKDAGPSAAPVAPAPASAPEPAAAVPANLDRVVIRQGATITPLIDKPQTVTFLKSEAASVGSAIANIVLSDVGLQLITMGLSSQMTMWNPYLGDTVAKAANLGKGMLLNRGTDTKGFEIETLSGMTADATLKEGTADVFVPLTRFLPSADLDPATIEPVLLRLEPRPKEGTRLLSGRKVLLKQTKKGRFDMKPTTDRIESDLEQTVVPTTTERFPDGVLKITTQQELKRGEYALVFRRKDAAGAYTANVPLKPSAEAATAARAAESDTAVASMPGMTPETWAQLTPEQKQTVQQQYAQMQATQQGQSRGGLFGRARRAPAPPPQKPASTGDVAGFLAWEFRVMP